MGQRVGKFIVGLVGGLLMAGVGLTIAIQSMPSTDQFGISSGDTGGVVIGVVLFGIGQTMFLIFTIALGVYLGSREAHLEHANA